MNKREIATLLANAYIKNFQKENNAMEVLEDLGISISEFRNDYDRSIEEILNKLYPDSVEYILDLCWNEDVTIFVNDKNVVCRTIDDIFNALEEDNEEV